MDQQIPCRVARPEDAGAVTALISAAFVSDPLWSWAMARPDGSTAHHARLWRVFVDGALRYPWTWFTEHGEACSVWIPPNGTEMSEEQEARLSQAAREVLGASAETYFELLEQFAAAHPRDEPHYYLSLLGTTPQHRGHGFGMSVLRHDLALIDAEGVAAYLESSNPANNDRYASVGFQKVGEFRAPGHGPFVTTMWRPAGLAAPGPDIDDR